MRDYGKVYSIIWESEDFRSLSEDGRTLVLYLLTCKHCTIAGVFRLPDGYACEDLQWSPERVRERFSELFDKGFATRCNATQWVWVTKFLEWNPPDNPNQRKAAAKVALSVPDRCGWKPVFMRVCGPSVGLECQPEQAGSGNPSETVGEGLLNQYQKQKQEQEQEPPTVGAAENGSAPPPPAPPAPPPAATAAPTRGSRLSKEWLLPKLWGDWSLKKYPQWTADKVRDEAAKFRNHWTSKSGKDATKIDWYATWQNWCMDSLAHRDDPRPPPGQPTGSATPDAEATQRMLDSIDIDPEEVRAAALRRRQQPSVEA